MGKLKVVNDFFPPPEQLVLREDNVKVTIALKRSSVEFFKKEAKKQTWLVASVIPPLYSLDGHHYIKNM